MLRLEKYASDEQLAIPVEELSAVPKTASFDMRQPSHGNTGDTGEAQSWAATAHPSAY